MSSTGTTLSHLSFPALSDINEQSPFRQNMGKRDTRVVRKASKALYCERRREPLGVGESRSRSSSEGSLRSDWANVTRLSQSGQAVDVVEGSTRRQNGVLR